MIPCFNSLKIKIFIIEYNQLINSREKALKYAEKAVILSRTESKEIQKHVKAFFDSIMKDTKGKKGWFW